MTHTATGGPAGARSQRPGSDGFVLPGPGGAAIRRDFLEGDAGLRRGGPGYDQ